MFSSWYILGVRHGLVVMISGSEACVRRFKSLLDHHKRIAWLLYNCAALWRAIYGPSVTERPLRTIHEKKGISCLFQVSISFVI